MFEYKILFFQEDGDDFAPVSQQGEVSSGDMIAGGGGREEGDEDLFADVDGTMDEEEFDEDGGEPGDGLSGANSFERDEGGDDFSAEGRGGVLMCPFRRERSAEE